MLHAFHTTHAVMIIKLAIATNTYTDPPSGTCIAKRSIHIPFTYHAPTVPMMTAGTATQSTSRDNISKMVDDSAPFTLRIAISLERRRTSSVV